MADVPAIDTTAKPLKKFSDSLKKSFTPRSSRASTPAGPSAATTPKAVTAGSPRDVKAEAKAAAKAAKEAVAKKAGEASAASKAAAAKAGKAAANAKANVKKAIEVGGIGGGGVEEGWCVWGLRRRAEPTKRPANTPPRPSLTTARRASRRSAACSSPRPSRRARTC
jgi:hypothetical protein